MPTLDPQAAVRSIVRRTRALLSLDSTAAEVTAILRDAHQILTKLASAVESLARSAADLEKALEGVTPGTFARLEKALANIERVTLGVESMAQSVAAAIPKPIQDRLARRKPPSPTRT